MNAAIESFKDAWKTWDSAENAVSDYRKAGQAAPKDVEDAAESKWVYVKDAFEALDGADNSSWSDADLADQQWCKIQYGTASAVRTDITYNDARMWAGIIIDAIETLEQMVKDGRLAPSDEDKSDFAFLRDRCNTILAAVDTPGTGPNPDWDTKIGVMDGDFWMKTGGGAPPSPAFTPSSEKKAQQANVLPWLLLLAILGIGVWTAQKKAKK